MKRIPGFFLTACCLFPLASSLFLAPAPAARAASVASSGGKVDVNFFYDQLKDQGSWFSTTEYGDVWQPYIAYKNDSWHPYTDGYWTYTDGGWMFVSYESFGWAVYHYGRWTHLKDTGWAWVPGTEWAPAWVTWRSSDPNGPAAPPADTQIAATSTDAPAATTSNAPPPANAGGNPGPGGSGPGPGPGGPGPGPGGPGPGPDGGYIGWAPLPPEAVYNDGYEYGPSVDVDFGIDPYDYCFAPVVAFGAPWIGGVIFGPDRSFYCCEHSLNITHLYYNRQGAYRGVFNGGPNFDQLRGRTAQPLQQLRINRQAAFRGGTLNRINGRNASVFAPRFSRNGVAPNGRVQFNRQTALRAEVLPGGQRGGGPNAAAQNAARTAFARQGQEFRQRNPASTPGGPARGGSVVATPEGVRSAPETANAPRTAATGPQKAERSVTPTATARRSRGGSSRGSGGRRTQSRGSGGGHRGGGGHSGGGHSGGGHGGSGGHGGGGKKH